MAFPLLDLGVADGTFALAPVFRVGRVCAEPGVESNISGVSILLSVLEDELDEDDEPSLADFLSGPCPLQLPDSDVLLVCLRGGDGVTACEQSLCFSAAAPPEPTGPPSPSSAGWLGGITTPASRVGGAGPATLTA